MKHHIVVDQTHAQLFCDWLNERCNGQAPLNANEARTIAYVLENDEGEHEILSVCAFSRWTKHTCEATVASDGSHRQKASRDFLYTCFDYAFNFAAKQVIYTFTAVDNVKSLKVQEMLGLTEVGTLPDHFGEGRDALFQRITRKEWKEGYWSSPSINKNKNRETTDGLTGSSTSTGL